MKTRMSKEHMQTLERPIHINELKKEALKPKKYQHQEKFTSVLREPNKNVYTEERAVRYVENERKQQKENEKQAILMAKLEAEYQAYLRTQVSRSKDESISRGQTDITSPESHKHSSQEER